MKPEPITVDGRSGVVVFLDAQGDPVAAESPEAVMARAIFDDGGRVTYAVKPKAQHASRYREKLAFLLGDVEGHPFRGNQYTDGEGGDHADAPTRPARDPEMAKRLPEDPDKYFKRDERTVLLPLDQLDPIRAREKGIRNAAGFMEEARNGTKERRKPISVTKLPSGRYRINDGNSTFAVASKAGWEKIPVHIESEPAKLRDDYDARWNDDGLFAFGDFLGHPFRGNQYTDAEGGGGSTSESKFSPVQHAEARETLRATEGAENAQQPLRASTVEKFNHGKAVGLLSAAKNPDDVPVEKVLDALGGNARAQFEELREKGEAANPVLIGMMDQVATALGASKNYKDIESETPGAVAATADVKSLDRAVKKAVGKDKGDARNVRDVVRSSVGVDRLDQLDDAITAVHEAVKAGGGKVIKSDNKFTKPLSTGYRDLSLNVQFPNGVIGEIQIHLKPMLYAKEKLGGHDMYEQFRHLDEQSNHRPLTVAEVAEVHRLEREMKALYDAAWKKAGGK